jgi:predicted AAA+ superfamily ATPase
MPLPLPRLAAATLDRVAAVMPVVVLTGARQTGKSTLARAWISGDDEHPPSHRYLTLDSTASLALARHSPDDFVRQSPTLVIDEVQRQPELLMAIKSAVDDDHPRSPGRFLLTGSANLLLMGRVSESLAGRAAYVTLHPLTRREQLGFGSSGIWSDLIAADRTKWRSIVEDQTAPDEDWRDAARRGGYPTPAYDLPDDAARAIWFDGYVRTYLERDVPGISAIENITAFDTVLRSLALRVGTLVNQTQLARDASLPQSTVQRYVSVLETSYQLLRIRAFARSRTRQLVKSPKYYWTDTGLAMFLAREREPRGAHLENLVAQDLVAWRDAQIDAPGVFHWRTPKGAEVDFVIQSGESVIGVEVKATTQPSTGDLRSLLAFLDDNGARARGGLLLHTGTDTFWIAPNVLATPWWRVI